MILTLKLFRVIGLLPDSLTSFATLRLFDRDLLCLILLYCRTVELFCSHLADIFLD